MRVALLPAVLMVSALSIQASAQQPSPARATGAVEAEATAILVDVVVRDRRGQPVLDLSLADFEILEDGVPQELGTMTLYSDGAVAPPATAAAESKRAAVSIVPGEDLEPASEMRESAPSPVLALVFDRLSPEARSLAHRAALQYVAGQAETDAATGVFGIDLSLQTYQTFTSDAELLRKALETIGTRSTAQFGSSGVQAREAAAREAAAASAQAAGESAAGPGGAPAGIGAAAAEAQFAAMERRMLETFEVLERDQQGLATANGLLAVVHTMRDLPGRKSVIFFSEGMAIPPNVQAQFRSVIDSANRANVSIYTMDAAGLRTDSTTEEAREAMMAAARSALGRNPSRDMTGAAMTTALERNEDLLRLDPHAGLGQLADSTGGVLIRSTNDLAAGLRRIHEDMRNYYMLSYVPANDVFDGRFRQITVRVKRPGVEVAARRGYHAVRSLGPTPMMAFEAPALAKLDATPPPNAFPVRAAAMRFPEAERPGLAPVLVTLSMAHLAVQPSEDGKTYRGDFVIIVRFRDEADEVVQKLSQHYDLTGPIAALEEVKQGEVLFYRQPELDPGVYTMETVVYDALAGTASVRFSTVEQPVLDPSSLRMSNLMLLEHGERLPESERPDGNPFLVGDLLLYPNLGQPLRKSVTNELAFFFTGYPAQGTRPQATLELVQGGTVIAQSPLELGPPDEAGRVKQVSRLPIQALPTGTYELRVVLHDGTSSVWSSVIVRLVE